jgi:hypothetical protein
MSLLRRLLVPLWLCLSSTLGCGQAIQNLYFNSTSNIVRLDFSAGAPQVRYTGIASGASIGEGIAHAEDAGGNSIIWVNANGVYDRNGTLMPGSAGIRAHPSSTEIVICPFPGDPKKYYIIYNSQLCSGLYYSVADLNLRGGLGDVTLLNTPFPTADAYAEGLEIVQIPCSRDYWLLAYQCYAGFKRFRISAAGIDAGTLIQPFNADNHQGRGELDYYQGRLGYAVTYGNRAFVAAFDPVSGLVTDPRELSFPATNGMYGLEFSPDATKVYFTDWNNRDFFGTVSAPNLYRYDFLTGSRASWLLPYNTAGCPGATVEGLGQIELARDGKLYIPHVEGCQITVVENPDAASPDFSLVDVNSILSTGVSDHIQAQVLQTLRASGGRTICAGESVQLSVTGGTNYQWAPAAGLSNPSSDQPVARPAVTTTYKVYADNAYNCRDSAEVTIQVQPAPDLRLTAPAGTVICGDVPVTLRATPGLGAYTWYRDDQVLTGATADSLPVARAGEYRVTVAGPQGCPAASEKTTVRQAPGIAPTLLVQGNTRLCPGETTRLATVEGDGYTYQWYNAEVPLPGATAPQLAVTGPGRYRVLVRNGAGCQASSPQTRIEVLDYPRVDLPADTTVCQGTPLVLVAGGAAAGITYRWSDNSTGNTLAVSSGGTYSVTATNGSCVTTRHVEVSFLDPGRVKVPNVITPNGDAYNEFFVVENGFGRISLQVCNRWGEEVFRSDNYLNDWNAAGLPPGTYFYRLASDSACLGPRKGWLHIQR